MRKPSTCNCAALRRATRYTTRLYDDALAPVGLGLNQYSILANLGREGAQVLQGLADLLVMDRSTLGHLLRPLEARGLVTLTVSPRDKRQRVIALTGEGTLLLAAAHPHWRRAQAQFEDAFGSARAEALRDTLAAVTALDFSREQARAGQGAAS